MKNSFNFLFLAFMLVAQGACVKNTSISGTISDKATGMPLEGVSVSMSATKYKSSNDKVTLVSLGADKVVTGSDGRYLLEIDTKRPDELGMGALKDGYVYVWEPPRWGKDKKFDFEMDPIDAAIRITIINESGYSGKTYALAYEGGHKLSHYFYPWPVILNKGESLSRTLEICGNSFTEIRWGSQPNQPLTLHAGVQRDSIFCPRNDTTEYLLKL
jgi:hypothetical protein